MENMSELNWLAVSVGIIVSFLLGYLWYLPSLFGQVWASGSGIELPAKGSPPPVFALVSQLVAIALLAVVIGFTAEVNMLLTAIFAILSATVFVVSGGAFVKKTTAAMAIDGGYVILCGVVMIVCQSIF